MEKSDNRMKLNGKITLLNDMHKQFSIHYQQGEIQQAAMIIFNALEKYYEDSEGFFTYPGFRSHDIRPGYRLEHECLNLTRSFIECIGPNHIFGRATRLGNRLTFLNAVLSFYPENLFFAELKAMLLLEMNNPIEALAQIRATLNIKPNSPKCESLLGKVLKYLDREGLLHQVELNNFERAFLSDLSYSFCQMPFTNFEVFNSGDVYVCCGGVLPAPIGNIFHQTYEEIWNSNIAQEIRRSVLEGDYTYCSRSCELIRGQALPRKAAIKKASLKKYIDTGKTFLKEGATYLNMAHDYTCNLHCPSCRRKPRVADAAMQSRLQEAKQRVMDQVLPHVCELQIAGDGDPFASKHYRSILASLDKEKHPNLRLRILTNGVLFTPKVWEEFSNIHEMLETVEVSVDAANPETYKQLRRGGDFERLINNLRFLTIKRAEKAFDCLQLNFVVQKSNFREMPDFVRLGQGLGVDKIVFQHLHNQLESLSAFEFDASNVFSPNHPEYNELLEVLAEPILNLKKPWIVLPEMGTDELSFKLNKISKRNASACPSKNARTGWWWMPGHGGVGIAIEQNGDSLHVGISGYLEDGRPVWYACVAEKTDNIFQGSLLIARFNLEGHNSVSDEIGTLQLSFSGPDKGAMSIKNGKHLMDVVIEPYLEGESTHRGLHGWYRTSENREARVFMEIKGGSLFGALFLFKRQGEPIWFVFSINDFDARTRSFKSPLFTYKNGQVLGCEFKPAQEKKAGEMVFEFLKGGQLKLSGWVAKRYS